MAAPGAINDDPAPARNGNGVTDDQRRIPSDRRRAGQILADGWPATHVATQFGVAVTTVERWRADDADFRTGYLEETQRVNAAAERQRVKILLDLDSIVDTQLVVAKDSEHRDWARMSMYLVDKVMIPQSAINVNASVNVEVAFHSALTAIVAKLTAPRQVSATAEPHVLPTLLVGEAAAESYGAASLKESPALRDVIDLQ